MRIGLFGTFDVENYGDLLFPIIAERELKQRLENIELLPYSYREKRESDWYYNVRSLSDLQHNTTPFQALDCILIGGGHLLRFDKSVAYNYGPPVPEIPHPAGYWLAPALAGVFTGQPVLWNAPSASDDFPTWSHELLRFALENSAYVSVRDRVSLESLRRIGYRGDGIVVPDTVFSLARHFPPADLYPRTKELLSSIGLKRKYIVVQATQNLEAIVRELLSKTDVSSEYDLLALPIGPILGDNAADTLTIFPQAKSLPAWPSPIEIAGLVAHSSGVVALSLHLSITALVYGLPVLRPKDAQINKYELLRSSENTYFFDLSESSILLSYTNAVRADKRTVCSLIQDAQPQLERHWNTISGICLHHKRHAEPPLNNYAKANFLLRRRELYGSATDTEEGFADLSKQRNDTCVILHLYYPEMWDRIATYLANLGQNFDLFITIPEGVDIEDRIVQKRFPYASIHRCKNRGRDIAPFLEVYTRISKLGYTYVCKVHTKKSPQYPDGDEWNWDMWDKLLGSDELVNKIKRSFDENARWGMVAPSGHLLPLMPGSYYWGGDQSIVEELALLCGASPSSYNFLFAAGSMFWFKPEVFQRIAGFGISVNDFEPECGQIDGTLAHAFERFFGWLTAWAGYEIAESDIRGVKPSDISFHLTNLLRDFDNREKRVSNLTIQVAKNNMELSQIYRSKTWRLVQLMRRIRLFLIPIGSTREQIVRKALQAVRSLRAR